MGNSSKKVWQRGQKVGKCGKVVRNGEKIRNMLGIVVQKLQKVVQKWDFLMFLKFGRSCKLKKKKQEEKLKTSWG